MKQLKYMSAHEGEQEQEKDDKLECIVCRQEQEEGVMCLGWVEYSKIFSSKLGLHDPFLYFKGCMHPVHPSCTAKPLRWCPLCKKPANLLFPCSQFQQTPTTYEHALTGIKSVLSV